MARLIAVAGGIGSGKSVVSRILSEMGFPVYDCDSMAKALIDESAEIKAKIAREVSESAIKPGGSIDRKALAEVVFADKEKLNALNGIVHGAVKSDISKWAAAFGPGPCWVESAIIYESGIDKMVDEVWMVEAPEDIRIERVMSRSGLTREAVVARIKSQTLSAGRVDHPKTHILVNDGLTAVLPQVLGLLAELRKCK